MQKRLAVKRLTASDLTIFERQFRKRNAGNQKSINLNADVFIDKLFPFLPEASADTNGRIPLDLYVYGPGHSGAHNLQRKIFKGRSHKTWRLNGEHGEYIYSPGDEPERYNILQPRDLAVFEFQGRILPTSAKMVLVSQTIPADRVIHESLTTLLGDRSMVALTIAQVQTIADRIGDDEHPFHELTLDVDLEDAALGGVRGTTALNRRPLGRAVSRYALERARRVAEEVGRMGEEFVLQHLLRLKATGAILDFTWTSVANAVAPYDFLVVLPDRQEIAIDVKSTGGEFERPIHTSSAELIEMTGTLRYDIYRVFELSETSAVMRIAERVGDLASVVLDAFAPLPAGVEVDGVSLDVSALSFGPPISLTPPTGEEIDPID
jgi:hypothetical protein